jgi:hypothetical protein
VLLEDDEQAASVARATAVAVMPSGPVNLRALIFLRFIIIFPPR